MAIPAPLRGSVDSWRREVARATVVSRKTLAKSAGSYANTILGRIQPMVEINDACGAALQTTGALARILGDQFASAREIARTRKTALETLTVFGKALEKAQPTEDAKILFPIWHS
jgi:hypothetical protein